MDGAFWAKQRVLVTGHTGFKGAWLSLWLRQLGAEVIGFSLPPLTEPSLFDLAGMGDGSHAHPDPNYQSHFGSITDAQAVDALVSESQPTIIIHLAAQALVRASYDNPADTFATNVVGTANVLNAARSVAGLRAFVSVTSDKCYENQEWDWGYRESEPMGGHDPYSASKGCAELVTAAMRSSYFEQTGTVGIGTARAGNVIGGGDWAQDRLIPDIVRAFSVDEEVVIRRPDAVRPWQHVLEPLSGYLLLAEKLAHGEAAEGWNFGPAEADARPVNWIVERMAERWGNNASWRVESDGPHEATMLKLDCSKARNRLHWRPRLDLETTIDWLIDWYKAQLAGADMRAFTQDQIAAYSALPGLGDRAINAGRA
ncbi:MAG: CDP-glucose 4,6-dehydratase [Acidimicrobiales bacterium]